MLALCTLSSIQFSFTLTATKNIQNVKQGYIFWFDFVFGFDINKLLNYNNFNLIIIFYL
jgi:hypothetical protein